MISPHFLIPGLLAPTWDAGLVYQGLFDPEITLHRRIHVTHHSAPEDFPGEAN